MNPSISDIEKYLNGNIVLLDALGINDLQRIAIHPLGMGEHNLNFWFEATTRGGCLTDDARLLGSQGEDRVSGNASGENASASRKFVLRINVTSQPFHDDQVGYEFSALQHLKQSGCTPIPLYLDKSANAPGDGVIVESFCEGEELDFDDLRPGDLRCVAQLMADCHSVDVPPECSIYAPRDPIRSLFDECLERYRLYEDSAFSDDRICNRMDAFAEKVAAAVDGVSGEKVERRIINTESLPSHYLIPEEASRSASSQSKKGRFCAHPGYFVDWERPILGDVAQDVAFFIAPTTTYWDSETLFPKQMVQGFVEDYWQAVDGRFSPDSFEKRFDAYYMLSVFRALTWCTRAEVQRCSGSGTHITDKATKKVPIYLSNDFMDMLAETCFGF